MDAERGGSPQGATISPPLANPHLHYVLDLWVRQWRSRQARGDVVIVRHADDFIVGFQHESDARRMLERSSRSLPSMNAMTSHAYASATRPSLLLSIPVKSIVPTKATATRRATWRNTCSRGRGRGTGVHGTSTRRRPGARNHARVTTPAELEGSPVAP